MLALNRQEEFREGPGKRKIKRFGNSHNDCIYGKPSESRKEHRFQEILKTVLLYPYFGTYTVLSYIVRRNERKTDDENP